MPRQNRVAPDGTLHAVDARGAWMGNRGVLHDEAGTVRKSHTTRRWITCATAFKGRKRTIMAPGCYTELFFLDEATAYAAGHRPCAECRRPAYRAFTEAWTRVHGPRPEGAGLAAWIDAALDTARRDGRRKRVFEAPARGLPDGAMVVIDETPALIWRGAMHDWSFDGYGPARPVPDSDVAVLTPAPVVALFRDGLAPQVALRG